MSKEQALSLALRIAAVSLAMAALVGRDSSARALQAPPPPVVAAVPNLMAYWPFDETAPGTAQDFSGNANDGIHNNSPAITTSLPPMANHPANQRSLQFVQASNQSVSVNSSATLALTGSFTLSAWIYPTAATGQKGIIEKWDPFVPYPNGYDLRLDSNNQLSCNIHTATGLDGRNTAGASPHPTLNAWNHVVGTYNSAGGILTLYINGVAHPTVGTGIAPPTAGTTSLLIGDAQGANRFQGNIDEVRIYNRELSAIEVDLLRTGQEAPSGLAAAGQPGQINLTWNAPAGGAPTSYSVLRGPSLGVYDTVFNNVPTPGYNDTSVTPGTTYHYVVVAVSVLASDYSNSASAAASPAGPPPPPPAPRTQKLGERHMCGCSTVQLPSWGTWGAAMLAAAALILARRRR